MTVLVIHQGSDDLRLKPIDSKTYSFRIGSGQIIGRKCENLNDVAAMNRISAEIRDSYTSWVFRFNKEFLGAGLIWEQVSMFFFSDLSSKRTERFDTYNTLTILCLIREKLADERIEKIILHGVDNSFLRAVQSCFKGVPVKLIGKRRRHVNLLRRIIADLKFLLSVAVVIAINQTFRFQPVIKKQKAHYFFSFFPQTFDANDTDTRYGAKVRDEDQYLVALMADGMHQQIGPLKYLTCLRRAQKAGFSVVDLGMKISDAVEIVRIWLKLMRFLRDRKRASDIFLDIDISGYIYEEIVWSISRIIRLVVFARALERTIDHLSISKLTYIVFEFPLGRVISAVVGKKLPHTQREGFNHGEFSWRFLNYFLAQEEGSVGPSFLQHCPIPDSVLAEDNLAADIYRFNGYQNVHLMDRVNRNTYLDDVVVNLNVSQYLVVAGLHDGEDFFRVMLSTIKNRPDHRFLFRPHPRGDNRYLRKIDHPENLVLDTALIQDSLSKVSRVFVTYSGIGYEAARLGLPVTVVHIPGRINWSKCIDVVPTDKNHRHHEEIKISFLSS